MAVDMNKLVNLDRLKEFQTSENASTASEFSTSKSYAAGAYVYYKGKLYKFKSAHAAGAWTTTDVEEAKLADDVSGLKSAIIEINNGLYKKSDNLLDFGFIGGTWEQGGIGNSNPYMCKLKTPIPVSEGDILYGCLNRAKFEETFSFNAFAMSIVGIDENGSQVGNAAALSTLGQLTGSYTVPSGVAGVNIILSSTAWNDQFTPSDLDNAVEAFAYLGYENISYNDIEANYVYYTKDNAEKIEEISEAFDELKNENIGALIDYDISLINKLNANNALYGFKSSRYVAKTTNESWVADSHVIMENIPVTVGTPVCFGCLSSKSVGTNAGNVQFFNSVGEVVKTIYLFQNMKNRNGGFVRTTVVPENAVTARFALHGISSGEPTVVGETYFIFSAFFYIGSLAWHTKTIPTEWENAIETMKTQQGASLAFGIQTDTHYYRGMSLNLGFNLNEMSNIMGFDFIANLGDFVQGYDTGIVDSNANTRQAMTDLVRRYTENSGCPVAICVGNHDSNYENSVQTGEAEFTNEELFARLIKPCINKNSKAVCENGNLYYYMDFPSARVIIINSQDGGNTARYFGISNEQETWFTTKALDTTKPVLVLSHVPLVDNFSANYQQSYTKIVNALEAFKNNGGTVIACMYGHTHAEANYLVNGINHIAFNQTFLYPDLTASFVFVDTTAKTIKVYGFGSATNREFTYT